MEINRRNLLAGSAAAAAWPLLGSPCFADDKKAHGEMPKDAVILVAQVKAKAGKEDDVRQALASMLEPTRKEEGCIHYILHQDAGDKTNFMFYEVWANGDALKKHGQTPHMKALGPKLNGLTDKGGGVTFYELVTP
ncbi:MAG TPA: putative quinol monooxygenase [Thermoguttaceae bacterium]|nr:putative quinol monooxygenase [Thermoguttaceae bacterium]